jgi:hypothetical protein
MGSGRRLEYRLNEKPTSGQPVGDSRQGNNHMNSSIAIVTDPRGQQDARRYWGVPTEELLLILSSYRQDRLDTLDDPELNPVTRRHTLEYLEYQMAPLITELKRRHEQHERHKDDPQRHPWPKAEHYDKTLQLAQELKASIPLSTYVQYTFPAVKLQRNGATLRGHCPYPEHPDPSPSFVVYDDNRFTCFGCGRKGDIYSLVAMIDNLDRFSDQVTSLASWAGTAARL